MNPNEAVLWYEESFQAHAECVTFSQSQSKPTEITDVPYISKGDIHCLLELWRLILEYYIGRKFTMNRKAYCELLENCIETFSQAKTMLFAQFCCCYSMLKSSLTQLTPSRIWCLSVFHIQYTHVISHRAMIMFIILVSYLIYTFNDTTLFVSFKDIFCIC